MNRTNPLRLAIAAAATLALGACGSGSAPGGSGSVPLDPTAPVDIQSFAVTGTSAAVNGVVPINPGVNSGRFTLAWQVSDNPNYTARVYASNDAVFDAADYEIAGSCGKLHPADSCHGSVTVNCAINNSNVVTCTDAGGVSTTRNLTTFFASGLPKRAYLVLRVCNAFLTQCRQAPVAVEFQ